MGRVSRVVALVLLSAVMVPVLACGVAPHDPPWRQVLDKAAGAVLAKPTVEGRIFSKAIVRFDLEKRIYDPGLLFRGEMFAGVLDEGLSENMHTNLAFWSGARTAGFRDSGTCAFVQMVIPGRSYLILLGVRGPYALEPVTGEDDLWVKIVRDYFRNRSKFSPGAVLPDAIRQLEVVSSGDCQIRSDNIAAKQEFVACVAGRPPRSRTLTVRVGGVSNVVFALKGENLSISKQALEEKFGTDLGFAQGIPLGVLLGLDQVSVGASMR